MSIFNKIKIRNLDFWKEFKRSVSVNNEYIHKFIEKWLSIMNSCWKLLLSFTHHIHLVSSIHVCMQCFNILSYTNFTMNGFNNNFIFSQLLNEHRMFRVGSCIALEKKWKQENLHQSTYNKLLASGHTFICCVAHVKNNTILQRVDVCIILWCDDHGNSIFSPRYRQFAQLVNHLC